MDIALIDPSLFTWPYDVKLAQGLVSNGHTVKIYGRVPDLEMPTEEAHFLDRHFYPGLESRLVKKLPAGVRLGLKGLSHIESMARLLRVLRARKPDVIHFQWTPLASIDTHFIPSFGKIAPVVLTVHDSKPFNDNPKSTLQRIGALKIFDRFDHLIVHTEAARDRVVSYGIDRARVSIVAHGLLMQPASELPSETADTHRKVRILLFGQIKPYKGADVLVNAVAALPAEVRSLCEVMIVGRPGMDMAPLLALVDRLGLQDVVTFDLRFVPDEELPALLSNADIQVFPYREIDASGVLMLAMAAGRPMVASNIGLFAELMSNLAYPALVEPNHPDQFAAALLPLIRDAAFRDAAGREVMKLCRAVPSWQQIASATEQVYRGLAQRG